MPRVTIPDLYRMRREKQKMIMMTAYDFQMARMMDKAGVDIILVGDSGATHLLGHDDANALTMDEMVVMARAVTRGSDRAMVVADMPFMSYQISNEEAVRNAGRLIQQAGVQAVKVEAHKEQAEAVGFIVRAGVPVMGHIGITPMGTIGAGGFRSESVQIDEERILNDARALKEAGAFSLFLSRVPPLLAGRLTRELNIPTLSGAGAAAECDGHFGFTHSALGLTVDALERPAGSYGPVAHPLFEALKKFVEDARAGKQVSSRP